MQIDIHADDYGLTESTSQAILECINKNKLNSISVMPNMNGFSHGVMLWETKVKQEARPDISVHLNFMEGHCVSSKEALPHLVDRNGLFCISWEDLVKYNFMPRVRKQVKIELKKEIKAQIQRVADAYGLDLQTSLRVDSHQHTHMIPLVMEAIVESVKEEKWVLSYMRNTREVMTPYLNTISLWDSHELINFIKVLVLNSFAIWDKKWFEICKLPDMILSGVFFSGEMSYNRVKKIFPQLLRIAEKRNCNLEILFHPGTALVSEIGEEFNHPDANVFYTSEGRQIEYKAVMQLELFKK